MPNPMGVSFAPTFENSELAQSRSGFSQPQEALQVLSYRLPRVRGAGSISPLVGDQMRGGPNMSVLESVFRTILGPDAAAAFLSGQMPQGGAAMGQPPSPVVHPIGPRGGGVPPLAPPFNFRDHVPGGGILGGVLRGRRPEDVFGNGGMPVPSSNPFAADQY